MFVHNDFGNDLNSGMLGAPLRTITAAFALFDTPGQFTFQPPFVRIVLLGGTFRQSSTPGSPLAGEEVFPLLAKGYIQQISIEAEFPGVAAVDDTQVSAPPLDRPLFRIAPGVSIRFKDFRVLARGQDPDLTDIRKVVDFGGCFDPPGAMCQTFTTGDNRVLIEGMLLRVDRAVGSVVTPFTSTGTYKFGGALQVCLVDTIVESPCPFLVPDTEPPGQIGFNILGNSAVQIGLGPSPMGPPDATVTLQRTRVIGMGGVDLRVSAVGTTTRVRGYAADVKDHQRPAIRVITGNGLQGTRQLEVNQCTFRTDQAPGGQKPNAIEIDLALDPSFANGIANTAFAGHDQDIQGGVPANLGWDGYYVPCPMAEIRRSRFTFRVS